MLTTRRVVHLYYGDEIAMQGGTTIPTIGRDFPAGRRSGLRAGAAMPPRSSTRMRELLHFRADHPALRRGGLTI